jgi:hypothetical protein
VRLAKPSTYTGGTCIQDGTLTIADAGAIGASEVFIQTGAALEFQGNYSLANTISGTGRILTGPNTATLTGTVAPGGANELGTLTVEDLDFRGICNWEFDGTNSDRIAAQTLVFGDTPTVNATYLGSGSTPFGTNVLFTYTSGATPDVSSVSVAAPKDASGSISVDSVNKEILLILGPKPNGMQIILR